MKMGMKANHKHTVTDFICEITLLEPTAKMYDVCPRPHSPLCLVLARHAQIVVLVVVVVVEVLVGGGHHHSRGSRLGAPVTRPPPPMRRPRPMPTPAARVGREVRVVPVAANASAVDGRF